MATKSSLKKAKQFKGRNLRNKRIKKSFKMATKKLELAIKGKKDKQELNSLLKGTVSLIDKAVSKGVLHKNNAARKKSLLSRKVRTLSSK